MNISEHYLLDSIGFLRYPAFLSATQVELANERIDELIPRSIQCNFRFLDLDPLFLDLLSHPTVMEICSALMGCGFRFDHVLGRQQGVQEPPNLHGGRTGAHGAMRYLREGNVTYCGQLAFGFSLCEQGGDFGGFTFLPGSHRSGFPITGQRVLTDVLESNAEHDALICPSLAAGDMIVFFESLIHGCSKWRGPTTRRSIYYQFTSRNVAWRSYGAYSHLARNDLERALMLPPFVRSSDDEKEAAL